MNKLEWFESYPQKGLNLMEVHIGPSPSGSTGNPPTVGAGRGHKEALSVSLIQGKMITK